MRLDGETRIAALRRLLGELAASFRPGSVASAEEMARGGALLYGRARSSSRSPPSSPIPAPTSGCWP